MPLIQSPSAWPYDMSGGVSNVFVCPANPCIPGISTYHATPATPSALIRIILDARAHRGWPQFHLHCEAGKSPEPLQTNKKNDMIEEAALVAFARRPNYQVHLDLILR